jgi:membrane protein
MSKVDHRFSQEKVEHTEMDSGHQPNGRGRDADVPRQLPKTGWRDILWRVYEEVSKDNISLVAAGVAFYLILALVPAMGAVVSIYGLVTSPEEVQQQISSMSDALPKEAQSIIQDQLKSIATTGGAALSFGAIGGLLFTLWSASKGMQALMTSLNITYDEEETRSFLKFTGVALLLTIGGIIFLILTLFLITSLPALLETIGLGGTAQTLLSLARWPILAMVFMTMLAVLYRYAPCRHEPKWQWVTWGAGTATILWLIVSAGFAFYADNYGSYNETYGSLGAVVILLMWFWLTAFIILLGAELNSEMEHQTRKDTTVGEPKEMGQRGAYVADHLGQQP